MLCKSEVGTEYSKWESSRGLQSSYCQFRCLSSLPFLDVFQCSGHPSTNSLSLTIANLYHRGTPVAFLHRLVWYIIPRWICTIDDYLTKGRLTSMTRRWSNYLLNENHPLILVLHSSQVQYFLADCWPDLLSHYTCWITVSIYTCCVDSAVLLTTPSYDLTLQFIVSVYLPFCLF